MYKVMIVDDEKCIRKGLQILINWGEYGFSAEDEAANGMEALRLLEREKFDVIITDIRMPRMDGLELAKQIYEMNIRTNIIIISGYKDFEYARSAIEFGVKRYILKPIDQNLLIDALLKIKKEYEVGNPAEEAEKDKVDFIPEGDAVCVISRIKKYIDENCSRDISLKSIAKDFNYNPVYLGRLFSKITHISFRDYLNRCRIEKAAGIILGGKYKIQEVSEMVGYKDINYFCSAFKGIKGITPSEFRAQKYTLS